jgi:hypothetical protein
VGDPGETDAGDRPGLTTEERTELTKLRRENRRLREDNETLKRATAFVPSPRGPTGPRGCTGPSANRASSLASVGFAGSCGKQASRDAARSGGARRPSPTTRDLRLWGSTRENTASRLRVVTCGFLLVIDLVRTNADKLGGRHSSAVASPHGSHRPLRQCCPGRAGSLLVNGEAARQLSDWWPSKLICIALCPSDEWGNHQGC